MTPEPSTAQFRFACVYCRKMIRKPMPRSCFPGIMHKPAGPPCAGCGTMLIFVGRYFEPPRRNDLKAWKRLELRHTQKDHWFTPTVPDGNSFRIVGPAKYYAKIPKRLAQEKQRKAEQRALCAGKGTKQQEVEKKQRRLASRSQMGGSLTNISDAPRYGT